MKVGGESWLVPRSPFVSHCTYWAAESTATTAPSQSCEATGVRTAITAWYREASEPRQEARIPATVPASIGVVFPLVNVHETGAEVTGPEDTEPPPDAPAAPTPRVAPEVGVALCPDDATALLVGIPAPRAVVASAGLAVACPWKAVTAATLTTATAAAAPSGSPQLRRSEAGLSSGLIFMSSSSRIRRWLGRSRSGGAAGMPCVSFIVRPPPH